MFNATRWWCAGLLAVGAILLAFAGSNRAQDKKPFEKHDGTALYQSLRDVINTGAKMFNEQGDHAGCYRLYQGSLLSVRPFLPPETQKKIDQSLGNAERLSNYADRAFELRRILDEIRNSAKPGSVGEKKDDKKDAKKDDKDNYDKKKDDMKDGKKKDDVGADKGQVTGKITFQGKGLPGGYFVTLIGGDAKKFSSAIQKDGSFQFKTAIPVGEYRVAIEPIPGEKAQATVPVRYTGEGTSGLSVRIQAGAQKVNLDLVN